MQEVLEDVFRPLINGYVDLNLLLRLVFYVKACFVFSHVKVVAD